MEILGTAVFLIGIASSLHCLGMCGGIITALSLALPPDIRKNRLKMVLMVICFNLGRILSYTIAGALAGLLGNKFTSIFIRENAHLVLQLFAGITLILIGLHIGGWLHRLAIIEAPGAYVWKYLQPVGKHFLPVTNAGRALFSGVIWGWLPCALIYSALLLAVTTGSWQQGATCLFLFGLGTLPGMFLTGIGSGIFRQLVQNSPIRRIAGVLIIIIGLVTFIFPQSQFHNMHGMVHKDKSGLLQ